MTQRMDDARLAETISSLQEVMDEGGVMFPPRVAMRGLLDLRDCRAENKRLREALERTEAALEKAECAPVALYVHHCCEAASAALAAIREAKGARP